MNPEESEIECPCAEDCTCGDCKCEKSDCGCCKKEEAPAEESTEAPEETSEEESEEKPADA